MTTSTAAPADLKPTRTMMRGAWIEVFAADATDLTPGHGLASFNVPMTAKSPAPFTGRVLKKLAAMGYTAETMLSMNGRDQVIKIG